MNETIARDFVNAINEHHVAEILALMAEDHVFIDAYGNRESKEAMKQGWPGYFSWFPDYLIEVEQVMVSGDTVALFGYAGGTYRGRATSDNRYHWRIPAVWRAVVNGGKVRVWQVYADSKIPYDIMDLDKDGDDSK